MANASIAHIGQFFQGQHKKHGLMGYKSDFSRCGSVRLYTCKIVKGLDESLSFFATSPPKVIDLFSRESFTALALRLRHGVNIAKKGLKK